MMIKLILAVMLSCSLFGGSLFAKAQATPQNKAFSPPDINITEADMKKFQEIQPKIQAFQKELVEKIKKAENTNEARELQMKYQEIMIKFVKDKGLSVDKYNAIAQKEAAKQ
jgi:membrane protein insertase Oxa1/YidC/SpoIIIJ